MMHSHRPPARPPHHHTPPRWWLIRHGFILKPELRGYPVPSQVRFRQNPAPFPRRPWPYESETRAPGTGLAMGRIPRRRPHLEVVW
jgi:hypothetical protein